MDIALFENHPASFFTTINLRTSSLSETNPLYSRHRQYIFSASTFEVSLVFLCNNSILLLLRTAFQALRLFNIRYARSSSSPPSPPSRHFTRWQPFRMKASCKHRLLNYSLYNHLLLQVSLKITPFALDLNHSYSSSFLLQLFKTHTIQYVRRT